MNTRIDTRNAVNKLVDAILASHEYSYATGYLVTLLSDVIDKYVPEDEKLMLRIELLDRAINNVLDARFQNLEGK